MNNRIINKTSFLDEGVYKLQQGQNIPETMDMIFSELHQIRQDVPMEVWRQFVSQECRQHPLTNLVLQDPLSWRIFAKPRGYAGDAIMLDFIYAYDYLPLPVAQRLSERLFRMLNPGGRLLLANFIPNISNVGFMEAFLDWWLIYRTRAELLQVADTVPDKQLETMHIFMDENINIAFLEIERKG